MNKINIFPIFRDHFRTFTDSAGRCLFGDYVLFVGMPIVAGAVFAVFVPRVSSGLVDFLLLVNSIFVPLMMNVLFLIYGLKQRHVPTPEDEVAARQHRAALKLMEDLYKNLLYAVVVSCCLIGILGLTKLLDMPPPIFVSASISQALQNAHGPWETLLFTCIYVLTIHIALTVLMTVKRSHALLSYTAHRDSITNDD